jgi:L-alanine-DL-glutamate epimerase-like enolase superfamily enzyme
MKVAAVSITVVEVPQNPPVAPYASRLRATSTTTSAIVRVDTHEGVVGWGEFNLNFVAHPPARELEAAAAWLVGRDPLDVAGFHRDCPLETRLNSGLEMALWDLRGKAAGFPVAMLLGGILRDEIELAACMGIQTYARAGEIAAHYADLGYSTLKIKAGRNIDEDCEMVRGVRDAVGDRLAIRVDPNCGYTAPQAAELARRLEPHRIQYLEQPIAAEALEEAGWLRKQTSTPIALNESVTDAASVWDILRREAAAFILPDTHIAGGIGPCVEIGHLCQAAGVPCIMHCGHDLGPKTAAMLHVAAACPAYSLANDSTYDGLADDVIRERLPIVRGRMRVPRGPGLGIEADPAKLARYAVP